MQKIPVGLATQAGLTATLTAYVLAFIAFIQGDRTEETIGALTAGTVALVTVLWGRYRQAVERAKAAPPPPAGAGSDDVVIGQPVITPLSAVVEQEDDEDLAEQEGVLDVEPDDPAQIPPDKADTAGGKS